MADLNPINKSSTKPPNSGPGTTPATPSNVDTKKFANIASGTGGVGARSSTPATVAVPSPQPVKVLANPAAVDTAGERDAAIKQSSRLDARIQDAKRVLETTDDLVFPAGDTLDQQTQFTEAVITTISNKVDSTSSALADVGKELKAAREAGRQLEQSEIDGLNELSQKHNENVNNLSEYVMRSTLELTSKTGTNAEQENAAIEKAKIAKRWAVLGAVAGAGSALLTGGAFGGLKGFASLANATAGSGLAITSAVRAGAAAALEPGAEIADVTKIGIKESELSQRTTSNFNSFYTELKATSQANPQANLKGAAKEFAVGQLTMAKSFEDSSKEAMANSLLQGLHQLGENATLVQTRTNDEGVIEKAPPIAFVRRALNELGFETRGGEASKRIYSDYDNNAVARDYLQGNLDENGRPQSLPDPLYTAFEPQLEPGATDSDLWVFSDKDETYEGIDVNSTGAPKAGDILDTGLSHWTRNSNISYGKELANINNSIEHVANELEEHVAGLRQQLSHYWRTSPLTDLMLDANFSK